MSTGMITIRQQLTRQVLSAFIATLLIGGVGGFVILRSALQGQFNAALGPQADAVSSVLSWDRGQLHIDTSERFMRGFEVEEPHENAGVPLLPVEARVFEIWRADTHQVLARSPSLDRTDLTLAGEVPAARPIFWNMTLPSGSPGRAMALIVRPRLPREGVEPPVDVLLMVAADRRALDRTLRTVAWVLAGCGLLLIVVTIAIVPRVLRRQLAPLDRLADQATRIDAQSLSARFPTAGLPGELLPIGERLNDLLQRLEQAFGRERQFSADVAHELRTPLAELRTATELALKWPDARTPAHDRELLLIAAHMEGIVSRLLALLRSERGHLPVDREPINVAALLRDIWRPLAARADANNLTVTWHVPDETAIHTDRVLLRSILTNILENAAEYTPARGAIDISSDDPAATRWRLRIANTVVGLTADDVQKLFDRFWRRDTARANTDHSGLGLSLAHAFTHTLGGELTATLEAHPHPEDGAAAHAPAHAAAHVSRHTRLVLVLSLMRDGREEGTTRAGRPT
jgi:signal transduction histidine kinase